VPGIDDDELGAIVYGILDKGCHHRVSLGHIAPDRDNHLGLGEILERIGHGSRTKALCQTGHRRRVADPGTVVDVVRAQYCPEEFLHLAGILVDAARRADPTARPHLLVRSSREVAQSSVSLIRG